MANEQYEMVKDLLTKYPEFRDSDNKLMAHVWRKDFGYNLNLLSAEQFLQRMASNDTLSSWASITRYSRKVQELHPELEGKNHKHRKLELEPKVIDVINQINKDYLESEFDKKFGEKPYIKDEGIMF